MSFEEHPDLAERRRKFWERYASFILAQPIAPKAKPYYVGHAQRFLADFEGRIRTLKRSDLEQWCESSGRESSAPGWQLSQELHAVSFLLTEFIPQPWALDFPWQDRMDAFLELEDDHVTYARRESLSPANVARAQEMAAIDLSDSDAVLLKSLSRTMRSEGKAIRTEQSYREWIVQWMKYRIREHSRSSAQGALPEIGDVPPEAIHSSYCSFLEFLAVDRGVSKATQNLALNALVYFARHVLDVDPSEMGEFVRPKRPARLPDVLNRREVTNLLNELKGRHRLIAQLLYGSGLRLMECIRLRLKDLDLDACLLTVRGGKGGKDRVVPIASSCLPELEAAIEHSRQLWEKDREMDVPGVVMPTAGLERKYPNAGKELAWQWLFPSMKLSTDPATGIVRRHHIHENGIQKVIKPAAQRAGILKRINCHTLRHTFATQLIKNGVDIRTVQELMGHADVKTTMIYTHVIGKPGLGGVSPLDFVGED